MNGEPRSSAPRTAAQLHVPGYKIEGVIGRGSTGTVYRARQLAVDREVALKVLHPELASRPRTIQRLQREARTTARLAHPHIVSAIDMGETGGTWWFAMELVDGPSLGLRLRQEGRLDEREALRLFIPLCEALVHMHENGVVHRDIKPSNILIDRAGGARLADLGLAFADDDPSLTRSEATLGTPHYASPEQLRDPRSVDIRGDIWSLGATMFHTVCGRPPFAGDSLAEVLSAVLYAPVPDPSSLEPDLAKGLGLVLRKCLSRAPEHRYQSPRELVADLERVRERRKPKVRAMDLEPTANQLSQRTRLALVSGSIALAAGLAWAGFARPWEPAPAPPYPPLEAVAESFEAEPTALASALSRLEDLASELPPGAEPRWRELRRDFRERLTGELAALQGEFEERVGKALDASDLVGARGAAQAELERELLARTGFTPERLPPDGRLWIDVLHRRVEQAELGALAALRSRLESFLSQTFLPRAGACVSAQRWRDARALLALGSRALLEQAGADASRLSDSAQQSLERTTEGRLAEALAALDRDWRAVDRELASWIVARAAELAGRVERRELTGAVAELRRTYELELEARRLAPEQMLLEVAAAAAEAMERAADQLDRAERNLRERDLDEGRALLATVEDWLESELGPSPWARRDYATIRERWQQRLDALAPVAASPWGAHFRQRLEARAREAELLQGLLQDAATGVKVLDANQKRLALVIGSIAVTGRVRAGADPLAQGFLFFTGADEQDVKDKKAPSMDVTYVVRLRPARAGDSLPTPSAGERPREVVLDAAQVEMLANLGRGAPAEQGPERRLARAFFRLHEGDPEAARKLLEGGPTPAGDELLAADLRARIQRDLEARARMQGELDRGAEALLATLTEARVADDPRASLEVLERLLGEYAGAAQVRDQETRLRALRADAQRRARAPTSASSGQDLAREYGAIALDTPDRDRVRLRFDLSASSSGRWELGTWSRDGLGWLAPGPNAVAASGGAVLSPWERMYELAGPELALAQPLDPDLGTVLLTLRVDQLAEAGPPKLLVVSLAGFHVALAGPGLEGEGRGRLLVDSTSLDRLLDRVRTGEGRAVSRTFESGSQHELEIEVERKSGRVRVALDGSPLGDERPPRPGMGPTARKVALRAWESLRLREVVVELGRR